MALDKVDLSRMNDKKRAEKRKQKDAENPGFFSGVIARGLRGNAIDKAHAKSEEMIKQYGGDAAKSRGFMAYDKPVMKKAMGGAMHKMPDGTMMQGAAHGKAAGGKLKMVEKGGKKVPAFAADGVGKMAVGGFIGALMNKGKPGGMLAGVIPGGAGMLARLARKKTKEEAAQGSESMAMERKERKMAMERKERKMAMGGKCRGMGAASKGGNYKG